MCKSWCVMENVTFRLMFRQNYSEHRSQHFWIPSESSAVFECGFWWLRRFLYCWGPPRKHLCFWRAWKQVSRCFWYGPFHLGSYRPLTSYLPLIYRALLNSWEATVSPDEGWRKRGIKILQSLVMSRVGLDLLQSCLTSSWLAAIIPTACFFLSLKRNYIAFYLFDVCHARRAAACTHRSKGN